MPRGASPKREKEYEEMKGKFEKSGRYRGREKQVAARIVNKQRAEYGETRQEKAKDRRGESPDRDLPVKDYQHLTIGEIRSKVSGLSAQDRRKILQYEKKHKNRKGVLQLLEKKAA
jgi:hypothetical protein